MKQKFYRCQHCGNIIEKVNDAGVPVICCGEPMKELKPGTSDGAAEKHVPVYEVEGNVVKVAVGSVTHPMVPEHFIEWISVATTNGTQMKHLKPGQLPAAEFVLTEGEEVEAVYAYCNLHSLWMN